jgi:ArsR family transcriptional regulator, arsenate/arsenite/antimonite-responsive transcriptional repressor
MSPERRYKDQANLLLRRVERSMANRPEYGVHPADWVNQLQTLSGREGSDYSELLTLFGALAEPVRIRIVALLARKGELCACEIQAAMGKSQSLTSHHLNVLRRTNVVKVRRKGTWMHFSLEKGIAELLKLSLGVVGPGHRNRPAEEPENEVVEERGTDD